MVKKQITFRIEPVVINWLEKRERESGKNTSDFLREIIWSVYHQELHQKISESVTNKFYQDELNSLEKDMKKLAEFLSNPKNQKEAAKLLLSMKVGVEQSGLVKTLFGAPKGKEEKNKGKKRKPDKPIGEAKRKIPKSLLKRKESGKPNDTITD